MGVTLSRCRHTTSAVCRLSTAGPQDSAAFRTLIQKILAELAAYAIPGTILLHRYYTLNVPHWRGL
jgi:hypothetical protein